MLGLATLETCRVESFELFDSVPVALGAGLLLLGFGRRIYWLLVAVAGFVLGFTLARHLLDLDAEAVPIAVGLIVGLICAAAAVLFQKVAVAAVGFVAGGLGMLYFVGNVRWDAGYWILVAALVGGIVGALLARKLFELALIVFTSIVGAVISVPAIGVPPEVEMPLFIGLVAFGVVIQLGLGRRGKKKE